MRAVIALALLLTSSTSLAQEVTGPVSGDLSRLDDTEVGDRLAFLEERLDAGQRGARIWYYGFMGLFSGGVVVGTVQASTSSDSDDRVAGIVGAAKGAIGTLDMLLEPHPGRLGTEPLGPFSGNSRPERLERLARAEAQLDAAAERSDDRFDWTRHAGIVALNAAGGLIVGLVGDRSDAVIDATLGFAVGQVMLWTTPQRPKNDLRDYRTRFGTPAGPEVSWHLAPLVAGDARGLALQVRF